MGEKKQRDLWNLDDLSSYLKLPRSTTHMLVAQGKIPKVKLGKHLLHLGPEMLGKELKSFDL